MPSIKGTVTRVVSATNFFVAPADSSHNMIDLEGHRVGNGEISVECHPAELSKGNPSRLRAWRGKLPNVGDQVELPIAVGTRGVPQAEEDLEPPTDDQIRAEAQRRLRSAQTRADAEARVQAEMDRIKNEGAGDAGAGGNVG